MDCLLDSFGGSQVRGQSALTSRPKRTAVQFDVSRMVTVSNQKSFQRVCGALDRPPRCPSKVRRRAPPKQIANYRFSLGSCTPTRASDTGFVQSGGGKRAWNGSLGGGALRSVTRFIQSPTRRRTSSTVAYNFTPSGNWQKALGFHRGAADRATMTSSPVSSVCMRTSHCG